MNVKTSIKSQFGFAPILLLVGLVSALFLGYLVYKYLPGSNTSNPSTAVSLPKNKKIMLLTSSDLQLKSFDGLKLGMQELGYAEGQNITYDLKNPKGDRELTKKMAAEIVAAKPDLIVPLSTTATRAILDARKNAQSEIPVVFVDVGNVSELGITDVKRPGNRASGIIKDNVKIGAKRMEIMKELIPNAKRFGVFLNPKHVSFDEVKSVHEESAKTLNIELKTYLVNNNSEVEAALIQVGRDKLDGFLMVPDNLLSSTANTNKIAAALKAAKIPSIDVNAEQGLEIGYLMSYGVYRFDVGKEGARLIDKVLKGEDPGEIPIEFASNFSLEINSELAKELGVTIPDSLRIKASKVL